MGDSAFLCRSQSFGVGYSEFLWWGVLFCVGMGGLFVGGELSGIIKLLLAGGLFDSIMKLEQIER